MPRPMQVRIAEQARELMEHNLSMPLTISALARELCVSPTTLKEAFRATYGTPI